MPRVQMLRAVVGQRLTAAVEEIFGLFERRITEYKEEIDHQRRLLEDVVKPEIQINKADGPQLLVSKEEVNLLLTAALEEMFGFFERMIEEYEEEVSCSKGKIRQHKLLDAVFNPNVQLHRVGLYKGDSSVMDVTFTQKIGN